MPGDGQFQFVGGNARAVVLNPDQGLASVFQSDVDGARARVQTVFDQLLDHSGRAIDHLPGGDLVAQLRRQQTYGTAMTTHFSIIIAGRGKSKSRSGKFPLASESRRSYYYARI